MSMRPLTTDEVASLQPSSAVKTVTVIGHKPPPAPPSGPPSGGGGTPASGPAGPGVTHNSPDGNSYRVNIQLSQLQTNVLDKIIDYGVSHGASDSDIYTAVNQAFYESALGSLTGGGTHVGIFQYDAATWAQNGEIGSISNTSDQVAAIFNDITNFHARYSNATAADAYGINEAHIDFDQYVEIKHHFGNSATNWSPADPTTGKFALTSYDNKEQTLGYGAIIVQHPNATSPSIEEAQAILFHYTTF